jgi:hypothetical protein
MVIDLPWCAVVASTATETQPQARLRLQVACARQLAAFLPLGPGRRFGIEQALDFARQHGPAIGDRLEALRGLAQISLSAAWPVPAFGTAASAGGGKAWLEARAHRRAEDAARGRAVREALCGMLAHHAKRCLVERQSPGRVQLAALCPADRVAGAVDHVSGMISRGDWPEDARFAITGPWPALAFAGGFREPVPT